MKYIRTPRDAAAVLIPYRQSTAARILLLDDRRALLHNLPIVTYPPLRLVYATILHDDRAEAFVFGCARATTTPTPADLAFVQECLTIGRYLHITLEDYLIIGEAKYWSLREAGQL